MLNNFICGNFHFAESKPSFAQVFNGSPYMIYIVVNNQKPVVRILEYTDINLSVLAVVPVDVHFQFVVYFFCVNIFLKLSSN